MKAIVRYEYGSADVLALGEVDQPAIGPREVLVRVRAAGVDRGVWHVMTGLPHLGRLAFGLRVPRNPVLGMDVSGVVEAVGVEVEALRPGDEVLGTCSGAFAELAAVREDRCVLKPAVLTFEEAAAVPTSAVTALQALRTHGRVRAGQRVLVIGAGGGVGSYAVQIAKACGAHVTGVCSTSKLELVRSLGADEVVDYTVTDVVESEDRFDLVLDIAGNRSVSRLRRVLSPRGTLVIVGGEGGDRLTGGMGRQLGAALLSPLVRQRLHFFVAVVRRPDLETVRELLESGAVRPAVSRTYALADAARAIRDLEGGRVAGKAVVTV
ncbi:NAD(P)-dependent alcohol dehydrogenase [Blastococcus sp. TF02A-35]|uniref:NAD(P)-dependent alcohol dehydrogenase n=1 Tax=Blastococcus sp. TF02A-35 TaxID=2559612 RepID=UPI0010742A33|nr:NAD(P)-dependent alcohol dehydrogenase [Blastococcus sp. TF02A_35]TFV51637.1 NAD(P)-dependent alcohol dehydrogenase [Blastococcus sp. TF02A_35]